MIRLLFVGDGPRDGMTVPRLVESILGVSVQEEVKHWKDLHLSAGKGLSRKLLFALRQAKDRKLAGLVATVDTDNDRARERLKELRDARAQERSRLPPFPTVLGQADPHGEAWLLDDPAAVRQAFGLPGDAPIKSVRRTKSPKEKLEVLKRQSARADDPILEILADIARQVQPSRCIHAKETGFAELVEETNRELGPLGSGGGAA